MHRISYIVANALHRNDFPSSPDRDAAKIAEKILYRPALVPPGPEIRLDSWKVGFPTQIPVFSVRFAVFSLQKQPEIYWTVADEKALVHFLQSLHECW